MSPGRYLQKGLNEAQRGKRCKMWVFVTQLLTAGACRCNTVPWSPPPPPGHRCPLLVHAFPYRKAPMPHVHTTCVSCTSFVLGY